MQNGEAVAAEAKAAAVARGDDEIKLASDLDGEAEEEASVSSSKGDDDAPGLNGARTAVAPDAGTKDSHSAERQ